MTSPSEAILQTQFRNHITSEPSEPGWVCSSDYSFPGSVTTSLLDVFHYFNSFSEVDQSDQKFKNNHNSHTDSGILTVVPCADIAGLEIFNQQLGVWVALEELLHARDDWESLATVFWGDSVVYL